jgi:hypothetical protein
MKTTQRVRGLGLVIGLITVGLAMAWSSPTQGADDWTVKLGTPPRSGTYDLNVTVTWIDSLGKKQSKKITSSTTITRDPANPMTADGKRALVQADLQTALDDPGNLVNGGAAAILGGIGASIGVDPNTGATPGIKIKKIEAKDDTGQSDEIHPPVESGAALAVAVAEGSITGRNTRGGGVEVSTFSIRTNLGTVTVPLSGAMTKLDLLRALDSELQGLGITVWLDDDGEQLILLLDGEVTGMSATTTDDGLFAVSTILLRD